MQERDAPLDVKATNSDEDGAIAEAHETSASLERAVSPTTNPEWRNTLRPVFRPVACWRIHAGYFHFDSSVILPELGPELDKLKPLIKDDRLASIFGHADPVGSVEYNAHLSARRARALYGLLTRNADVWLELYADGGQHEAWGLTSTQIMLAALRDSAGSPYHSGEIDGLYGAQTDRAIRNFQAENAGSDAPLRVDGIAGPKTRKRLYERYIDQLTGTPDVALMRPEHFLGDPADNADPKGKCKAAFQGCSEHNPILLFSKEDEQKYQREENEPERNERNAPNRRAMIFFFSKQTLFPLTAADIPKAWPCPAWDEGPSACNSLFWPNWKERLASGATERRYEKKERTMACRWYDAMARLSPCERPAIVRRKIAEMRLWLLDHQGRRMGADPSAADPILQVKGAPYRIVLPSGEIRCGYANAEGCVIETNFPNNVSCEVRWGKRPETPYTVLPIEDEDAGDDSLDELIDEFFMYSETIFVGAEPESSDLATQQLSNLGYEGSVDACRQSFAQDYGSSDDQAVCEAHDTGREKAIA